MGIDYIFKNRKYYIYVLQVLYVKNGKQEGYSGNKQEIKHARRES